MNWRYRGCHCAPLDAQCTRELSHLWLEAVEEERRETKLTSKCTDMQQVFRWTSKKNQGNVIM